MHDDQMLINILREIIIRVKQEDNTNIIISILGRAKNLFIYSRI